MSTYSANHGDQFTSFFGEKETSTETLRASTVKFREPKKVISVEEQEVIDLEAELAMSKTIPVKELKIDAKKFKGMKPVFVNILTIFSVALVGYAVGFAVTYVIMVMAVLIGGLLGSGILALVLYIAGLVAFYTNRKKVIPVVLSIAKQIILGYTWLHQGTKSLYNKFSRK